MRLYSDSKWEFLGEGQRAPFYRLWVYYSAVLKTPPVGFPGLGQSRDDRNGFSLFSAVMMASPDNITLLTLIHANLLILLSLKSQSCVVDDIYGCADQNRYFCTSPQCHFTETLSSSSLSSKTTDLWDVVRNQDHVTA